METKDGKKYEILNFSVRGYGAVQKLLQFVKFNAKWVQA